MSDLNYSPNIYKYFSIAYQQRLLLMLANLAAPQHPPYQEHSTPTARSSNPYVR